MSPHNERSEDAKKVTDDILKLAEDRNASGEGGRSSGDEAP